MSDRTPPGSGNGSVSGNGKRGHRRDGQPYKEGNTREDGSYKAGKYRPPEHGMFRKDDGRPRGKREKGSKNVKTIWQKKLSRKITINGVTQTSAEWLVESTIRRGITKSDRAAEKALDTAERFEHANDPKLGMTDEEIMAAWMSQHLLEIDGTISDDARPEDEPDDRGNTSDDGDDHEDQ